MKKLDSLYISYDYLNTNPTAKNWIIFDKKFSIETQAKFETILSIGNGYISSRAHHEGHIGNKKPGTFITGTFNTVSGPEVPELPNAADLFDFDLLIDGEYVDASNLKNSKYIRFLNLQNGLLSKQFRFNKDKENYVDIKVNRFISMDNLHLLGQKITLKPNFDFKLNFKAGINGQSTNSGANHFEDTYSEYFDDVLNYVFTTTKTKIEFIYHKKINFYLNDKKIELPSRLSSVYGYSRRKLIQMFDYQIKKGDELTIELLSTIHTTNDLDNVYSSKRYQELNPVYRSQLLDIAKNRFDQLLKESSKKWLEFWKENKIEIDTDQDFDILAIRFAQYHTRRFTPYHDYRCNIEAKGMVGEEYKGHTFWDTEIFIYPYYLYTQPHIAKQLLEHRYFVRNSALIKANEFGYEGYMWPWETCWTDDGETCPTWGAVDRKEGHRIKVWPAYNQHHIASCIYWAFNQYYKSTNDLEFMYQKGFNVLINTAIFWESRLEYNAKLNRYEILKVTGPNEYKEDIDNNVFTNYMAYYCILSSIEYLEFIKANNPQWFVDNSIDYFATLTKLKNVVDEIYLPQKNENGIIPENDTFLSLKELDMDFYKANPDQLWKDYTFPELNGYQVLKQADLIALFYTLGFLFDQKTIYDNWKFYEHRCLHHSSLSLSLHAVTANYVDDKDLAYPFFEKACQIDLGTDMGSCDNGIHAAATGGILKIVIEGFGGIKNWNNKLSIDPNLPKKWNKLSYHFYFNNQRIKIEITPTKLKLTNLTKTVDSISFTHKNKEYQLVDTLEINL